MDWITIIVVPLVIGFVLDAVLGDPSKLPHPIVGFGKAVSFLEKHLNFGTRKKLKGALMVLVLVVCTFATFFVTIHFLKPYPLFHLMFLSLGVFFGLANHTLIKEVWLVEKRLSEDGLEAGRKQVQRIVGRDTANLTAQQIRKAALETLSENLSDGVIAPLFYYAIGGVPLMFSYKMINTMDSMVGYKNERYFLFGWAAAKLDDVVNFVPARITAFLIVATTWSRRAAQYIFLYGHQHSSPNAGYPEAALAGVLNCQFGGDSNYFGEVYHKPEIGYYDRKLSKLDIVKGCKINILSSLLFIAILISLLLFTSVIIFGEYTSVPNGFKHF